MKFVERHRLKGLAQPFWMLLCGSVAVVVVVAAAAAAAAAVVVVVVVRLAVFQHLEDPAVSVTCRPAEAAC